MSEPAGNPASHAPRLQHLGHHAPTTWGLALALLLPLLLLSSCTRSEPELAPAEQRAMDHIARTPFLRITRVDRVDEHLLLVVTEQGGERVPYRIDSSDPDAAPHDMVQLLPSHGLRYGYDRNKPRGTFPTRR
ncbi:MAG: hypothetical protein ACOCXJ_02615 [Planctomycetota bacterium]